MKIELIEFIAASVALIAQLFYIGFYFGKLGSRLTAIEEKLDLIADEVLKNKVIKLSDFKKNKH